MRVRPDRPKLSDGAVPASAGPTWPAPRAVRVGRRARRRGPLWAGIATGVVAVGVGGADFARDLRDVQWVRYEPASWLLRDADGGGVSQLAALAELVRRITVGRLSAGMTAAAVDHALAVQGDRSKPWASGWGDLFAAAGAAGRVTPVQAERFARRAVAVWVESRPVVRRGRSAGFRLGERCDRVAAGVVVVGSNDAYRTYVTDAAGAVVWKVNDRPTDGPANAHAMNGSSGWVGSSQEWPADLAVDGPAGHHLFHYDVAYDVSLTGRFAAGPFRFTAAGTCPVRVVGHDDRTDAVVAPPEQRAAEAAAVREAVLRPADDNPARSTLELRIDGPPVALSADVFVVGNGRRVRVGPVWVEAGQADRWVKVGRTFRPPVKAGAVDVVLRPAEADAADEALTLGTDWGEPIVLHGVAAVAPPAAEFAADPALRSAMAAAVTLGPIRRRASEDDPLELTLTAGLAGPTPALLNCDVVIRGGGREVVVDYVVRIDKGTGRRRYSFGAPAPAAGVTTVDVELRPRPLHDDRPVADGLPWGEPIVFHDRPVTPAVPPSSQPGR